MKRQSECARHWPSALGIGPALAQREGKEIAERGDGRKTSKQPSALGVGLCKRRRGLGNKNAVRTGHRARKNTGRHSSSGSVMPYSPASRAALATVLGYLNERLAMSHVCMRKYVDDSFVIKSAST